MKIKILDNRIGTIWPLPNYATPGSAGVDLVACIGGPLHLLPGERLLISTGIAIEIDRREWDLQDNANMAAMIIPRSGLGHNDGVILGNSVGLIDSDYRGEIKVSLWNTSEGTYTIRPGDRIAQMVFVPVGLPTFEVVKEFDTKTERGEGGFGSTGV